MKANVLSRHGSCMRPGDKVVVIAGKDRGKEGKILEINRKDHRVKVESVALTVFTQKADKNRGNPGEQMKAERFIHISNIMFIGKDGGRCRLVRKNGKRINKKTGEEV